MISPTLIKRFNEAAGLAREGRHEEALKAFENMYAPFEDPKETRVETGEFLGTVEMRKAYCLMDLGRYKEACKVFECDIVQATLGQFNNETLYDYFFSYGNTLGNLGDIAKMDKAMTKALKVASETLGDLKRCEQCWYWLLFWAKKAEKWEFLEAQCVSAHQFGVNNGSIWLQLKAGEFGCYAYRGLGKLDKAERGARMTIQRYKDAKVTPAKIKEWEDLLSDILRLQEQAPVKKGELRVKGAKPRAAEMEVETAKPASDEKKENCAPKRGRKTAPPAKSVTARTRTSGPGRKKA
jgi:tetratricopeptide (TPR) repeat protein